MELSVMSPVLGGTPLKESIEYLASLGVDSIELGVGGYPGKAHADANEYAKDPSKAKELKADAAAELAELRSGPAGERILAGIKKSEAMYEELKGGK